MYYIYWFSIEYIKIANYKEILIRADSEKRIINVVAYILITKDDVDNTYIGTWSKELTSRNRIQFRFIEYIVLLSENFFYLFFRNI